MDDRKTIEKDMSLVGHVKVCLVAEIGRVEMTLEELFALRQQDTIRLDQGVDAPVALLINDKVVARGELMAVDDHLGVRITELD